MNIEDRLRADLHQVRWPASLVPPPGLADTVLSATRRQRRARIMVTAGIATLAAATLPFVTLHGPDRPPATGAMASCPGPQNPGLPVVVVTTPAQPTFPSPGGGPRVIDVFTVGENTYLLDRNTGEYRRFSGSIVVSPDGRRVAVLDGQGRLGVAERQALLSGGESAITWIDVPPGTGPLWSPDGAALLFTSTIKSGVGVGYEAHRINLGTAVVTNTALPDGTVAQAGWAADSRRYVVLLRAATSDNTFVPGALQYIDPDGGLGAKVNISGGLVGGADSYSPSRRYVLVDTTFLMTDQPTCSKVIDATTGVVVSTMAPGERPVGWYDDHTYVRLDPYRIKLQLVDVANGLVVREIPLDGAAPVTSVQLGSSGQLVQSARSRGF